MTPFDGKPKKAGKVLTTPARDENDPVRPDIRCAFGRIPAHGNRVLRVAYGFHGRRLYRHHGFLRSQEDPGPEPMTDAPITQGAHIQWDDAPIVESEEVEPGVVLDFDADGRVVGIELYGGRQNVPDLSREKVRVRARDGTEGAA